MIIATRIILRSTGRYDLSPKAKKEPPPVSNFFKLIVFLFVHWLPSNVSASATLQKKKNKWLYVQNKADPSFDSIVYSEQPSLHIVNNTTVIIREKNSEKEKQESSFGEKILFRIIDIVVYFVMMFLSGFFIVIGIRKKWFVKSTLLAISKFLDSIKKWML